MCGEEVDHLLDCTGTMHVQGDVDQVLRDGFADDVALLIRGVLDELLAQIISERIYIIITTKDSV